MKVQSEFSRYADQYGNYNIIQEKVVRKLLDDLKEKPKNILDLGCGKGALLARLKRRGHYPILGVELDEEAIIACVGRGLSVIQADLTGYHEKEQLLEELGKVGL